MRPITPELTDELLKHFKAPTKVGSVEPFPVSTFRELVEHTAKLAFKNKDHLIFYRGQATVYKNKAGKSTFYPSIYRGGVCFAEIGPIKNRKKTLFLINNCENNTIYGSTDCFNIETVRKRR